MVELPKEILDPEDLRMRKVELTLEPKLNGSKMGFDDMSGPIRLWDETASTFRVPRRYGLSKCLVSIPSIAVVDERTSGDPIKFQFRKSLWDNQKGPVEQTLRAVRETPWNGAILESPCGTGKTVMLLKILSDLGVPALVVVHKEFLMDQWRERIKEYLGIPEDRVGHIQENTCTFHGRQIALGMVQSLAKKEYPADLYKYFGAVVFDEVHRMGAPFFSQAVPKFYAKYRLGASATPSRKDGLDQVFLWHIGEVIPGVSTWSVKPKVYQMHFQLDIPRGQYTKRNGELMLAVLVNWLTRWPSRNEVLVREIVRAASKGRKILVLSDRLEHLRELRKMFRARAPKFSTGNYIGGMTEREREKALECDVLFGTYQFAKEGLDVPDLDTLYLATPHVDVEQAVGRILRECPGKKAPLVVDLVDSLSVTRAFAEKRRAFYQLKGFEVVDIKAI
jgi:superfamily II DNA or RNA helicase